MPIPLQWRSLNRGAKSETISSTRGATNCQDILLDATATLPLP